MNNATARLLGVLFLLIAVLGSEPRCRAQQLSIAPALVAPAYKNVPGAQARYALSYTSDSVFEVGNHVVFRLDGNLVVTVLATEEEVTQLLYRFADPRVSIEVNGVSDAQDSAEIVAALSQGMVVHRDDSGAVLGAQLPPIWGQSRGLLRTVAALMQVSLASNAVDMWDAREKSTSGDVVAHYAAPARGAATPGRVLVTKATSETRSLDGVFSTERKETTDVKIEFDGALGAPAVISGTEQVTQVMNGQLLASERASFRAELVASGLLSKNDLEALMRGTKVLREARLSALDFVDVDPEQQVEVQKKVLEDWTWPRILAQLEAEAEGRAQHDPSIFFRLCAYIFLHPEDSAKVEAALRPVSVGSNLGSMLLGALTSVGSPEATRVVLSALSSRLGDEREVITIVEALGLSAHPDENSVAVVRRLRESSASKELVASAAFALGSMAATLQSENPALSDRIVDAELKLLAKAGQDPERLAPVLGLLGNAASPRSLAALLPLSLSKNESIRSDVLWALRRVPRARAEERVLEAVAHDESADVRKRATRALTYREPSDTALAVLKARLLSEPSAPVRLEIVELLGSNYPGEDVTALLQDRAANDPDDGVRTVAARKLSQRASGGQRT